MVPVRWIHGDDHNPQPNAEIKRSLRVRAAMNGRPVEAEARAILTAIVRYVPVAEMPGPESAAPEKE
jgi:plasmid stability protein